MSLTLVADVSAMRRQLQALGSKAPLAAARALNRSMASVQTASVRAIATDLNVTAKGVRKAMAVERATRTNLIARLVVTGRRIALYAFRARQVRQGVTYNLGRGRGLVRGAFIATTRSGHVGVFRRRTTRRLPISELFGPSIPKVFTSPDIEAAREQLAQELLRKNLTHEIEFIVRGGQANAA